MLGFLQRPKPVEDFPFYSGPQYYVKMGGQPQGPYTIDKLRRVPGFTLQSPLCLTPNGEWKPAFTVVDLKAYLATPTKSNTWDQAMARAEQERVRQARKAKWSFRKQKIARFFPRLVFGTLGLSLIVAAGFAVSTNQIQPKLWKERLTVLAHEKTQWSIHNLQALDARYFVPKPLPAKVSTPPLSALRPAARSPMTKPRAIVSKRKGHKSQNSRSTQ